MLSFDIDALFRFLFAIDITPLPLMPVQYYFLRFSRRPAHFASSRLASMSITASADDGA